MNHKKNKIKKVLAGEPDIEFAYLFGSRARGVSGIRSDWDIAVFFRTDPEMMAGWRVFELEAEISKEIGEETQITVLNNLDSPVFMFEIIKGVLLIDNNAEKRILFEAKALRDYHDWQYYLERQMAGKVAFKGRRGACSYHTAQ